MFEFILIFLLVPVALSAAGIVIIPFFNELMIVAFLIAFCYYLPWVAVTLGIGFLIWE